MTRVRPETDPDDFRDVAARGADGVRVPVVASVRVDPFEAYRRARGDAPSFYFETSGGSEGWSYFGVAPEEFRTVEGAGAFDAIAQAEGSLRRGDCDVPFPGGWFGWLSYDAVREVEDVPDTTADDRGLPRLQMGRYPCVAAWREPHDGETTVTLVASPRVQNPEEAYERGLERVQALGAAALEGSPEVGPPPANSESVEFASTCGREEYARRVQKVQEYVRAGDTFQANVSHRLAAPAAVHPVEAFGALRRVNPAPYSGLLEFPGVDIVSASPELLLERRGSRLRTEPIAGTRPRGTTGAEDDALAAELRADEKERAEHAMLVDLERNDLGKVCEYGSVEVADYRRVDRYAEVMHLVSEVTGTLRAGCDLADAVRATFPGGTITGAPKPRTMEIIDELEQTRRGPYTGSALAVGFDGSATLNILIRTLVRTGECYHLRVGGGVVADSTPEREYEETIDKARGLVNALDAALGERAALEVEP